MALSWPDPRGRNAVWATLRAKERTDDPTPPDRFLGCYLRQFDTTGEQVAHTLAIGHATMTRREKEAAPYRLPRKGQRIKGYAYVMEI